MSQPPSWPCCLDVYIAAGLLACGETGGLFGTLHGVVAMEATAALHELSGDPAKESSIRPRHFRQPAMSSPCRYDEELGGDAELARVHHGLGEDAIEIHGDERRRASASSRF